MSDDNLLNRRRKKDVARIVGPRTLDDENVCVRCGVPDVHCQCPDQVPEHKACLLDDPTHCNGEHCECPTFNLIDGGGSHPCRFQAKCTHCGFHWPMGGYVQYDTARRVFLQHLHACEPLPPHAPWGFAGEWPAEP